MEWISGLQERALAWIRERPIPSLTGALVIGLLAGALISLAATGTRGALSDELAEAEELEELLRSQRDMARDEISEARTERDDARGRARDAYREAKVRVASEMDDRKARLDGREKDLDKREGRLDQRAEELDQAEQRQAQRVITEDGIWEAGADFEPGTYRSSGGGGCYWAKLSTPGGDLDSIIANGSGANQTVTIDSPWFETVRCGEWTMLGG